jgi:cephalosporin hydroxylase
MWAARAKWASKQLHSSGRLFLAGGMNASAAEDAVHQLRASAPGVFARGFHKAWWGRQFDVHWLGVPVIKNPFDLWIYQEIIHSVRPDLLIEAGTHKGGSAYFFASLFDLIGKGRVVTVDIEDDVTRPAHDRIRYIKGSSVAPETIEHLMAEARPSASVMVVLDSDHSAQHVRRELDVLSPLVTVGSYVVVEDTNINGHPVDSRHGPGPAEAVRSFLSGRTDFEVDRRQERFLVTHNPGGYLRRVRPAAEDAWSRPGVTEGANR